MKSQFPNTVDILQSPKPISSSKTLFGHFPQSLSRFSYCRRILRTRLWYKKPCTSRRTIRISVYKASDSTSSPLTVTQNEEEDDAESLKLFEECVRNGASGKQRGVGFLLDYDSTSGI